MKKYVNLLDSALHIYVGLGTWKNSELRLHIVSGTWKNSELRLHIVSGTWKNSEFSPFIWALGLKFHARAPSWTLGLGKISSFASIQVLGFEKMLSFPFPRLQPVGETPSGARCEVSHFCLLLISSKLFLLTYSSRPQKCERAVSTQHVSS